MKLRFKIKDGSTDYISPSTTKVLKEVKEKVPKNEGKYESPDNVEINKYGLYQNSRPSLDPYKGSGGKKNDQGFLAGDVPDREPLWNDPVAGKTEKTASKQEEELRRMYLYKPVNAIVGKSKPDFSKLKSLIGEYYDELKLNEEYKPLEYKPYNEKTNRYFWEKESKEEKPKKLSISTGKTLKALISNLKQLQSQGEDLEELSYKDYYSMVNDGKSPSNRSYIFRTLVKAINKIEEGAISKDVENYDANKHDCQEVLEIAEYLGNMLIGLTNKKEV